jgi:hypothetical protein
MAMPICFFPAVVAAAQGHPPMNGGQKRLAAGDFIPPV